MEMMIFIKIFLIDLREAWDSSHINDLMDSYGQEWSFESRKTLEYTCYTAFMISVVVTQWADLLVCKTRINSIVEQGEQNCTNPSKSTVSYNSYILIILLSMIDIHVN